MLLERSDFVFSRSDDAAPLLAYPASPIYLGGCCCCCWGCCCLPACLLAFQPGLFQESITHQHAKGKTHDEIWALHSATAAGGEEMGDARFTFPLPEW